MKLIYLFIFINLKELYCSPLPTVLWHGMGDTCCYSFSMGRIKKMIEQEVSDIYVYSIEIGDSVEEDEWNGFFKNVNDQIDYVCEKLASNPNLTNGFNALGFSQGSQFLRAYVERCNNPPVHNLISIGGQHQGVYGFPRCPGESYTLCEWARELVEIGAYEKWIQDFLVQAEYWHDPFNDENYLTDCIFLPDINNEREKKNDSYKKRMMSLNNFVMVKFNQDSIVQPKETEWFSFYETGQDITIIPLENSTLYTEDWIGLKFLDSQNKLKFLSVDGDHLQFTDEWFFMNIIPYLNGTL